MSVTAHFVTHQSIDTPIDMLPLIAYCASARLARRYLQDAEAVLDTETATRSMSSPNDLENYWYHGARIGVGPNVGRRLDTRAECIAECDAMGCAARRRWLV